MENEVKTVSCIYKSDCPQAIKEAYTQAWIRIINQLESCANMQLEANEKKEMSI